jgi:hypothetical protein
MRKYLLLYLFCLAGLITNAQSNSWWSFELAGSGGLGSFNYEKTFFDKPKADLNWRVGFSVAPIDKKQWSSTYFSCNGAQYFRGRQF